MIAEPRALGVMPDPVGEFDDFGETTRYRVDESVGSNEAEIAVAHEHAQTRIAAKIEGILELAQGWVRIVLESRTKAIGELLFHEFKPKESNRRQERAVVRVAPWAP